MTKDEAWSLANHWAAAWNSHDLDLIMTHYEDAVELTSPAAAQLLPHCAQGSPGEKVTCWPAPEFPATLNTTQLGNLGLTSDEEDDVVAFLKTLTDGFVTSPAALAKPAVQRGDK